MSSSMLRVAAAALKIARSIVELNVMLDFFGYDECVW